MSRVEQPILATVVDDDGFERLYFPVVTDFGPITLTIPGG